MSKFVQTDTILDKILEKKVEEVERCKKAVSNGYSA